MVLFIIVFCLLVAIGLGLMAAVSDYRGLIIPNAYPAGILVAFVPAYLGFVLLAPESGFFDGWLQHLLALAIVFVVTFILFSLKMFGAGDAKLCTAFSVWVGLSGLSAFVFYMAMAGGVLGLLTLWLRRQKPLPSPPEGTWLARAQAGENAVPYGIAITLGAMGGFIFLGYFSPENLMLLASPPAE